VAGGVTFQDGTLTAGYSHTCALTTFGTAWCWGSYKSASSADSTTPALIGGYTFFQITAGYQYSLGLLSNGTLVGWGYNGQYTLGIGSAPGQGPFYPPVLVSGNYSWTRLADARLSQTACAYTSSALMCWGYKCVDACSSSMIFNEQANLHSSRSLGVQVAICYCTIKDSVLITACHAPLSCCSGYSQVGTGQTSPSYYYVPTNVLGLSAQNTATTVSALPRRYVAAHACMCAMSIIVFQDAPHGLNLGL
jgi:hypothetical protein